MIKVFTMLLCAWLIGCTSMYVAMTDTNTMEGKSIDTVIESLQRTGYVCSEKREIYMKNWKELVGVVQCGQKDSSPICPNSYGIHLTFSLQNNLVHTATKTERANCF